MLGPNSRLGRRHITDDSHGDQDDRNPTRDQRITQLAKSTVTAVLAIPVWLIVIALLFGLLSDHGDVPIVVNDTPQCEHGPKVITADQLATDEYWEEC